MRGSLDFPESAWESPFLQRWRSTLADGSEAPECFAYGAALFTLGLTIGHRVGYRYGYPLRLNHFFGFLGPTGSKKTAAIEPAIRLLRQVAPTVIQLHGLSTAEGAIQILSREPGTCLGVIESELATLLAKTKRPDSILSPVICRMADAPEAIDLPTRGDPLSAVRPFVSLLAASTAAGIEDKIGEAEQLGGLLNRFVFFAGDRRPANPWPSYPSDDDWFALARDLEDIRDDFASVTWLEITDPAARKLWERYYARFYQRQGTLPEILCGLTSREHVHVLRFAMAFCVLRGGRDISTDDLERAIEIGAYLFAVVESTVAPIGQSTATRLEDKIERFLTERAMTRSELHQRLSGRVKSRDLSMAIETLRDLERIVQLDGGLLAWADADYFTRRAAGGAR